MNYTVWTDGSCAVHTTRCGGVAALVTDSTGHQNCITFHQCETTSQRMELAAALAALAATPVGARVEIRSDSQYLVNGAQGNWRLKNNLELWDSIKTIAKERHVTWTWIMRNSEPEHVRVDREAKQVAQKCPRLLS